MTKEEYGDFVLRYKGCGACFPMYHTLSRFEKMWFSAIQKDIADLEKENAELEDKLANADYQLEGRDLEIKELEAQIKKMKCCENCGWYYLQQHWRESKEINESRMFHCGTCGNKRNWKLKEIKE